MSDVIKKAVLGQLAKNKMTDKALNKPGAHIVVGGEGNDLHVLVKKSTDSGPLDPTSSV